MAVRDVAESAVADQAADDLSAAPTGDSTGGSAVGHAGVVGKTDQATGVRAQSRDIDLRSHLLHGYAGVPRHATHHAAPAHRPAHRQVAQTARHEACQTLQAVEGLQVGEVGQPVACPGQRGGHERNAPTRHRCQVDIGAQGEAVQAVVRERQQVPERPGRSEAVTTVAVRCTEVRRRIGKRHPPTRQPGRVLPTVQATQRHLGRLVHTLEGQRQRIEVVVAVAHRCGRRIRPATDQPPHLDSGARHATPSVAVEQPAATKLTEQAADLAGARHLSVERHPLHPATRSAGNATDPLAPSDLCAGQAEVADRAGVVAEQAHVVAVRTIDREVRERVAQAMEHARERGRPAAHRREAQATVPASRGGGVHVRAERVVATEVAGHALQRGGAVEHCVAVAGNRQGRRGP